MVSRSQSDRYFVPPPSAWPLMITIGLVVTIVGAANWLEGDAQIGIPIFVVGALIVIALAFIWFRGVIHESRGGMHNAQVDRTFRWSMGFFIFSEVMFFAAFFGALFYARDVAVPWLAGHGSKLSTGVYLWPGFDSAWPTNGPGHVGGAFESVPPWGLPFLNTILLLTSSVTVTWAHWGLKEGKKWKTVLGLLATVVLGASFLYFQGHEYMEAYQELNLTLHTGIFGTTFFMLTGFHGLHVTLGTIMLIVITLRVLFGNHFLGETDSHFGFEAVSWYWHFVDVVWLCLFVFVYIM